MDEEDDLFFLKKRKSLENEKSNEISQ